MCRIYNTVGALADIQGHLVRHKIDDFHSLRELLDFENQYDTIRQKLVTDHHELISDEKAVLEASISATLADTSQKQSFASERGQQRLKLLHKKVVDLPDPTVKTLPLLMYCFENLSLWLRIWGTHIWVVAYKSILILNSKRILYSKRKRLKFLALHFDEAVSQSSTKPLQVLERKRRVISQLNPSIHGAFGEQEVVEALKQLPDDYLLINNFSYKFNPPIYFRKGDFVRSVQIDHILVAPSCIFLIETKHWSRQNIEKRIFRSPIQQVQRAHYALFEIIVNAKSKSLIRFKRHPWGNKAVLIRNIAVFTRAALRDEYPFVKVLRPNQLKSYVIGFEPVFSATETEKLAKYLLSVSVSKPIASKLRHTEIDPAMMTSLAAR